MNKKQTKKIVIMVPEESINKILADHPEVELQIADQVLAGTANRAIKKALNDEDLADYIKTRADNIFSEYIKSIGVVKLDEYPYGFILSKLAEDILKPLFLDFLNSTSRAFVADQNKDEWKTYIEESVGYYLKKTMQETARKVVKEQLEEVKVTAEKVATDIIKAKFGV